LRANVAHGAAMAMRMLGQSAEGLAALHAVGIVHCDVSAKNVIASSTANDALPKIIDFDASTDIHMRATAAFSATTRNLVEVSGTRGYIAPEVQELVRTTGAPTRAQITEVMRPAIDVYGLAVVISEALGVAPTSPWTLPDATDATLLLQQLQPHRAALEGLMRRMLQDDPATRPTAAAAARELQGIASVLSRALEEAERAALAPMGCCGCLSTFPASLTATCGNGHAYCVECVVAQVQVWAQEPLARHQAKRGAVFCVYGGCGAVIAAPQLSRVAGHEHAHAHDAIQRARDLVTRRLADAEAVASLAQRGDQTSPSQRALRHIDEAILAFTCPKCAVVVGIDFAECLALTCPACGTHFCGWCREACETSAATHAHLAAHRDMPRHLDDRLWREHWLKLCSDALRQYTATLPRSVADEVHRALR
ncbi:MAG: protein kinase, partial [Flavobacteriaceae bacterium]|nr:protein kinase [Flavobacteriaceae bacterium]